VLCSVIRRRKRTVPNKPPPWPADRDSGWCAAFVTHSPRRRRAGRVFMRFNSLVGRARIRIAGRRRATLFLFLFFAQVHYVFTAAARCYSRLGCGAPRDDLASSELPQSRCLANLLCPGTDVCTTGPTLIYAASSGQAELSRPLLLAGERDLLLRVVAQLTFFGDGVLVLLRSSVGRYSKLMH
jgi:hypothetical protein